MKRINIYTRTPHDRIEHTLWYNPDMVSTAIMVTPNTYCLRIDGKDYLTDECDVVEMYILGIEKPKKDNRRQNGKKPVDTKAVDTKAVDNKKNI
jgi:hypothetical protein